MSKQDLHCYTIDSLRREPEGSGALDGMTFALKDLCDVRGHITSFGHSQWRKTHAPAKEDSQVLRRFLEAGATLGGVTKMDQLAYSIIGNIGEDEAPLNSKYPERYCGGSSSGSASAVAGGLVDFAVGSDTGGSVRIPAAVCGIYGIRTTQGLVSKDGVVPLADSADVIGFFARDPKILKKVLSVFGAKSSMTIKKVLLPKNLSELTEADYAVAVAREAKRLAEAHKLQFQEIDFAELISEDVRGLFARTQSREIWAAHGEWARENMTHLADEVQERLRNCEAFYNDGQSEQDLAAKKAYIDKLVALVGDDSIVCLTVVSESGPNRDWPQEKMAQFRLNTFRLSAPSSLSGLPQLSAPIKGSTTNIGILGPKNSDLDLVQLYI